VNLEASRLRLRPIRDEDLPFLAALYASTREQELSVVPWSEAGKAGFLLSQFQAQHSHYTRVYTAASFDLLLLDEEPIGRLYVDRRESDIHVIDIALVPAWCGQGIGSHLLQQLMEEAAAGDRTVSLNVEFNNPAQRLYARLGFELVSDQGIYHELVWRSPSMQAQAKTAS
jgi:RimJ/RimL family protein N-acetyltransferase